MKPIERVIRKRVVYVGRYLSTEQQTVVLPDGRQAIRDIVRPPDAVAVVPIDDAGRIHLVRQYRPAIRRAIYEIPAGIIDPGERPATTARRECEEEIGLRPRRLIKLCSFYSAVGFSTGSIVLFLAQGLMAGGAEHRDATEFLEVRAVPFEQAYRWVLANKIVDAKSMIGILWAKQRLDLEEQGIGAGQPETGLIEQGDLRVLPEVNVRHAPALPFLRKSPSPAPLPQRGRA